MAGKETRRREFGGGSRSIVGKFANEVGSETGGCEEKENAQVNPTSMFRALRDWKLPWKPACGGAPIWISNRSCSSARLFPRDTKRHSEPSSLSAHPPQTLPAAPSPTPGIMSAAKSRWADDDPETEAIIAQRKREKEEKRRAKAEKQRQLEEASKAQATTQAASADEAVNGDAGPPKKRRRLSNDPDASSAGNEVPTSEELKKQSSLLRFPVGEWGPCRHVDNFERLNHIEEGSYGWVSRAKDITTGEIVALKKLKIENSPDGFPVTGLREIQTLLEARHQNVVYLREVVMGNKMDE